MRTLVLMRGAPGSGKSTFIKKNNLEHYTLCTDDIRIMCGCKQYAPDGKYTISQSLNKQAWRILYTMLEERMKLGAFTVIDATHSTEKEMRGYKDLIDKYRYKVFVVDMTDVSAEELKDRNAERESYKRVPEEVIDKFSKRFETEKVPRGYTVIKPEDFWRAVGWKAVSVDEYKKVHHLGDIHGCHTVLQEYLINTYFKIQHYTYNNDIWDYTVDKYWENERWLDTTNFQNEEWRDIEGYEDLYKVSNFGRVKSLPKIAGKSIRKEKIITQHKVSTYMQVVLSKNGKQHNFKVHRLVAAAFLENLNNSPQVNHKDLNRTNNNVENLEWSTAKDNVNYSVSSGRYNHTIVGQYDKNNNFIKAYYSISEASRCTGIDHRCISKVCKHEPKYITAGGYIWKFIDEMNLNDFLLDDNIYIFVGDYTDRGIENVEVLQFLQSIYKKPNVVLIEGNHEIHMRRYLSGEQSYSKTFNEKTKPALDKAIEDGLLNKKVLRDMYRTMRQCFLYRYHDKKVICTHGGITDYEHFELINTDQMVSGVGKYEDYEQVAATFCNGHTKFTNFYQINGHRNVNNVPVQVNERCFNLEGGIEWGGCLRVVTLDENGFETHEIKNNVWDKPIVLTEDNIVEALRQNKHIKEKMYGNISSFNFTEEAFRKGIWDEQTCKARGLFINTETNKIAVRGYEKFFDGTREDTNSIEELADKLVYPVHAYVKYNGFLGMLSYDKEKDDLIFCTKSVMYQDNQSNAGTYVKIFKGIFERKCNNIDGVKQYLKEHDATMLFEVIDPENDPHIIEYEEEDVVLLDIVANSLEFKKLTYEQMMCVMASYNFNLNFKALDTVMLNKEEFIEWYTLQCVEDGTEGNTHIEGYVLEDDSGFMTKIKLPYYTKWKWARSVANSVFQSGKYGKYDTLTDELKKFHDWLVITANRYILSEDDKQIIKLRKAFYEGWESVWNSR